LTNAVNRTVVDRIKWTVLATIDSQFITLNVHYCAVHGQLQGGVSKDSELKEEQMTEN